MHSIELSVIIPFYRELDLIRRAVDSVLSNIDDISKAEILICNDGDISEKDIRSKLSEDANVIVSIIKNSGPKGPGASRNLGLDVSTGQLVAFLDADDYWLQGKLRAQLLAINSGATFVATGYQFDTGLAIIKPPSYIHQPVDVFLRRGIGTSTVMITRDLLSSNRFKNIRFAQDIDFWYALACNQKFRYHAVEACYVEYGTGGSTKNKLVQLQYLYQVLRINDIAWVTRIRVLTSYILVGVFNHYLKKFFA